MRAPLLIEAPGEPIPWARPANRAGGGRRTPDRQLRASEVIALAARYQVGPARPFGGAVAIEIAFILPRPARDEKPDGRLRPGARPWPSCRPDLDNLTKLVLDALEGIAYHDDGQVVQITAQKRYAEEGEEPRTRIRVDEIAPAAIGAGR